MARAQMQMSNNRMNVFPQRSLGGPAAVEHEGRARHQRGRLRGEKDDGAGQLLELSEAAELDLCQHFLAEGLVLEEGARHGSLEKGRTQAVHADTVRRE